MEQEKIRIGFLGYGTRALDSLMEHPLYEVKYFLTPRARLCSDVYEAAERYRNRISMEIIDDNVQLACRFAELTDVDCFLMNACSIILNREVLSHMRVFNIHPGDLKYNRGHQPHMWTVLLGERETKITLHEVNEHIDMGAVVKTVTVPVFPEDDALAVLNRAEDQIPVLLDALYGHLKENAPFECIEESGTYRRIMKHGDYEFSLERDTREQIQRKILARSMNHGAFFIYGGQRIYVDHILFFEETAECGGAFAITVQQEEGIVTAESPWRKIRFHLNKTEPVAEDGEQGKDGKKKNG